ncbi:MAG: LamG domain-containing protein [Planctomycetaceae bacterium]|nr:LamG domain-containing protein [Planctomycetaceae bacterium]
MEVWMRPATLQFPGESPDHYIHWLGKGNAGQMEWGFRFYSMNNVQRRNRVSAYAWNPEGHAGAGAYYQGPLVQQNHWIHLVACFQHYVAPSVRQTGVQFYINGALSQGPPSPGTLYYNPPKWNVVPQSGDAPLRLGTRSTSSYLTGSLDEVAVYPRVLRAEEVLNHYSAALRESEAIEDNRSTLYG